MLGVRGISCINFVPKLMHQSCVQIPTATVLHVQCRSMARGRSYYIKNASKNTGISAETRDLIANACHAENIDVWQREPGIGEPYKFSQYRENPDDIDDESNLDMVYYPHKGEEPWEKRLEDFVPSPVLLVERIKPLKGEPWWHKMDCERIGLGPWERSKKRVALPNFSYYNALLYRIKHLIKITPVEFPNGVPPAEEFDPNKAIVTHDGKFLYHPKIGEKSENLLSDAPDKIKIQTVTHTKESKSAWKRPWGSPYGTSNYHRDYTKRRPEKTDYITDDTNRIKF